MTSLRNIEGIGAKYARKLKEAGAATVYSLLDKGRKPGGRKELALKSGISETLILEWVNHADLFRIRGVGEEYADLLEEAGVDTVPELAQRNPIHLHEKLLETNRQKRLVRRLPTAEQISEWVAQAKRLPRMVEY